MEATTVARPEGTGDNDQQYKCFFYGTKLPASLEAHRMLTVPAGTLMAPQVLYRVIYGAEKPAAGQAGLLTVEPAILEGYCRRRVKYADYPGVTAEAGKSVRGTYVTGLTEGDMWRLDTFEGTEYIKETVKVQILDKEGKPARTEEAQTYIYQVPANLEGQEWDFEHFKNERMKFWIGSSKEYAG